MRDSKPSSPKFQGSLEAIRAELKLSPAEFKALRRAFHDAEHPKAKSPKHEEEDEDWIDWGLRQAKRFGPALLKLIESVA